MDADPKFVDSPNGVFRLQSGSPGIDAGIHDTAGNTGKLSYSWDAGTSPAGIYIHS